MRISDWSSDVCSSDLRPLDFAAVTDHSDFLGDWRLLCQVDGALPIGINAACNVVGTYLRNNVTTIVNGDQPAAFTLLTAAFAPLPIVMSIPDRQSTRLNSSH